MKERVFNFSAGPSVLPEEVLQEASKEMMNYEGCGMSVMEMSHRSKVFQDINDEAEALLRELMNVPEEYRILFLQGGASTQFSMVPLNLMTKSKKADYIDSGSWSSKAAKEAARYGEVNILASSKEDTYRYIPKVSADSFTKDADYFHITTNNTIYGTRFTPQNIPKTGEVPLVADMSSNILSEVYDVRDFSLIYAGAQKNMGPAGVTAVIIKDSLIGNAQDCTPIMLNYKTHADANSLYNTPPCFSIYMCMKVFRWLNKNGGIQAMEARNKEKAALLYDFLDESVLFKGTAVAEDRSLMNIPFVTGNADLDAAFIKEAQEKNMVNLKGHRSVGGMRASIYNAMPLEGVKALVEFMKQFETDHK
ncbi:MAG TPA: 3-phosphoserine/phosphohydroxythreonine aminotransferase [Eubacteriaceae bacterium]|nr:3-phosphoserine/phosphohydroxythreonine aminotransferase [Eubacteriaceae bacterium]